MPQPGREQPEHLAGRNQTDQPQHTQNSEPPDDRYREVTLAAQERRRGEENQFVSSIGADQGESQSNKTIRERFPAADLLAGPS